MSLWSRMFRDKSAPSVHKSGKSATPRHRSLRAEVLEDRLVMSTVYGVLTSNQLVRFDSATPGILQNTVAIQGVNVAERVVGIDFRPRTGQLFGLAVDNGGAGVNGRLLRINPVSGASTQVGGNIIIPVASPEAGYGFDFNPTVDLIRVVNTADANFRLNPNTGAIQGTDPMLNPAGQVIEAAAYDRNFDGRLGANGTTLYSIDASTGMLLTIGSVNQTPSPNTGMLFNVGPLGTPIDANSFVGFDIKASGTAAAGEALATFDGNPAAGFATGLYRVNLQTGAATFLGLFGNGTVDIQGIAIAPDSDLVVGADAGGGPHVRVFDAVTRVERFSFFPYNPTFMGGVRVATADVNRDSVPDIITGAGPGGGPHVRVFDGVTGQQLPGAIGSFFAFDIFFGGGVNVAAGDVNGDGFHDVIVGADANGGPHVKAFSGFDGSELSSFFAYAAEFMGGVRVAAADFDLDGDDELITGAGAGGGPHVRIFDAGGNPFVSGNTPNSLFAYNTGFTGGVNVSAGDVNGDGRPDIITGAGAGGGPHVRALSGVNGAQLNSFFAFEASFTGGVRPTVEDINQDGLFELAVTNRTGRSTEVRDFNALTQALVGIFAPFGAGFTGGAFIAGARR